MGKKLIVKDVDYSTNGITIQWLLRLTDEDVVGNNKVATADVWYVKTEEVAAKGLLGNTISYIKLYMVSAGTIQIGSVTNGSTWSGNSYNVSAGVNVIQLVTPITFSSTRSIGFSGNGMIRMWNQGEKGWLFSKRNASTSYAPKTMPIDFGV